MRVGLIGATGFVGGRVLDGLLAAGHEVRVLVRRPEALPERNGVERRAGTTFDDTAVAEFVTGLDAGAGARWCRSLHDEDAVAAVPRRSGPAAEAADRRAGRARGPARARVTELSDDLGFANPSQFVKFFRRITGETPVAFRARMRAPIP